MPKAQSSCHWGCFGSVSVVWHSAGHMFVGRYTGGPASFSVYAIFYFRNVVMLQQTKLMTCKTNHWDISRSDGLIYDKTTVGAYLHSPIAENNMQMRHSLSYKSRFRHVKRKNSPISKISLYGKNFITFCLFLLFNSIYLRLKPDFYSHILLVASEFFRMGRAQNGETNR